MDLNNKTRNRRIPYKWIVMMVVAMGTLMSTMDMGGTRVVLPHLEAVFGTTPDVIVWVTLIWVLLGSSLMLSMGRASDIVGRKKLYTAGFAVFIVGLALCSLAQNVVHMIIARFFQSIGAAMTIAISNAIITASFPAHERGKALGIMGAIGGLGLLSGPPLAGLCLDTLGWRSFFYLRIPFTLIGFCMSLILLKEQSAANKNEKFDLPGAITLFLSLSCLLLAVTQGRRLGWTSPPIVSFGGFGVLSLITFMVIETKTAHPVLDLGMFKYRLFSIAVVSHLLLYASTIAVDFLMPFYLIDGLGISASKSGLILITIPAFTLFLSPASGRLSDRLGTLLLCALGFLLISVGFLFLSRLSIETSIGIVLVNLVLVGIGMGIFVTPNTSAIMGAVPGGRMSSASAMIGTLRHIGMSVGLAVAGSAFTASRSSNVAQLTPQGLPADTVYRLSTIGGVQSTIIIALVIGAVGLVVSVLRGGSRRKTKGPVQ